MDLQKTGGQHLCQPCLGVDSVLGREAAALDQAVDLIDRDEGWAAERHDPAHAAHQLDGGGRRRREAEIGPLDRIGVVALQPRMGEGDHRQVLRAQEAQGAEHVEMLERPGHVDPHQRLHEHINDPPRVHVRGVEGRLDLLLHTEASRHPGQHRIRLAAAVGHGLQQGGDEA